MPLDNRERTAAANALIEWFNHQEVAPRDADAIMCKVIAKLIMARVDVERNPELLHRELDTHCETLSHEVITRAYQIRRRER